MYIYVHVCILLLRMYKGCPHNVLAQRTLRKLWKKKICNYSIHTSKLCQCDLVVCVPGTNTNTLVAQVQCSY